MKMNIKILHEQFCNERLLIKNFTESTIVWYKRTLSFFLKFNPDIESVDEVSTTHLERWLYDGRIKRNWTADTFLNYYKGIKVFLDWCVKKGYISENPILPIEKPKLEKKLPKRISIQDAMKLLEFSFHKKYRYRFEAYRNRAIISTFIYTGLRAKELLDLRLCEVDTDNNVLSVVAGKGKKDRVVPMSSKLKVYFLQYIRERGRLGRNCERFFVSIRGDVPFTYNGMKKMVDELKTATGISFSPHKLRHTFATLMLEGGCDLFSLQKMMGHSDIKTTTIYLSASVSMLQKQILKHPLG